jgi:hypothetical protein
MHERAALQAVTREAHQICAKGRSWIVPFCMHATVCRTQLLMHALNKLTDGFGYSGYYNNGPPVMAPPQYAAPPPKREPSFLEGW